MLHLLYALLATARSSLKAQRELALDKDAPELRKRESADGGKVIALPMVGELHHRRSPLATDKVLRNDTMPVYRRGHHLFEAVVSS
jgi:hypothetical protein